MGEKFFDAPDPERDRKSVQDEEKRGTGWNAVFYKPKAGIENVIRILPPPAGSGASWHIKVAKHFIKHGEKDYESFVCMKEVYGQPCPACEQFHKLSKDDPARANYSYRRSGVFNIIDRLEYKAWINAGRNLAELPKVRLYEGPVQAVWFTIVQQVSTRGQLSHIFDDYDVNGNVTSPGRDWIIYFNPNMDPQSMYRLNTSDPCPLGTVEEIKLWLPQIMPLFPEKIPFYAPIDYVEAQIKTFGSLEERKLLRLSKQAASAKPSSNVEKPVEAYPKALDETPAGEPETGSDGMSEEDSTQKEAEEAAQAAEEAAKKAADAKAKATAAKKLVEPKKETPKTEAPKSTVKPPVPVAKPETPVVPSATEESPKQPASLQDIQKKIAEVRAKYAQGKK